MSAGIKLRYLAILTSLITLFGCSEEEFVFKQPPKTPMAKSLDSKFDNWEAWQATVSRGVSKDLFMNDGKGYLSLSFQSPVPLYSSSPTIEEREKLGAELLHHCRSQRGKEQLEWIADWALGKKITKSVDFVRLVVRYETKPQGEPDRDVYGYEARYTLQGNTCAELVSLSDRVYKKDRYVQYFQ